MFALNRTVQFNYRDIISIYIHTYKTNRNLRTIRFFTSINSLVPDSKCHRNKRFVLHIQIILDGSQQYSVTQFGGFTSYIILE